VLLRICSALGNTERFALGAKTSGAAAAGAFALPAPALLVLRELPSPAITSSS